jgi:hypothetical protein
LTRHFVDKNDFVDTLLTTLLTPRFFIHRSLEDLSTKSQSFLTKHFFEEYLKNMFTPKKIATLLTNITKRPV